MVHHMPSKARARSVPVFIHPPIVHPLDVMWPVWMLSSPLVACTMVFQHHPCTRSWFTGVSTPVLMVEAHGTSHTIQSKSKKCASFCQFIQGTFFGYDVVSVDVVPFFFDCVMVYQRYLCIY